MVGAAIHWRPAAVCCAILVLGLLATSPSARAASIDVGSGTRIEVPLKSMKDLRDQGLVKQRFDYSCGAAALATVLRYGFGDEVTERDILTEHFGLLPELENSLDPQQTFIASSTGTETSDFRHMG